MTSQMRPAGIRNPMQGFAPRLIKTVTTWNCAADGADSVGSVTATIGTGFTWVNG